MAGGLSAQCASISENGSLASVSDDLAAQERNPERSWTIGMYWAADNNIDSMTDTFLDIWLDNLWNRDDVSLAIFIDRLELPANISTVTEEGWIERECMGDVNSSDPETLSDFIEFFMTEQYLEAEHYMLVVQDHGLGYLGICVDEGEEGRPWMSIDGLGRALDKATATTGKKLDIIDLDACTLATVEVAYELRNKASYLVASEIAVPFDGINYMALLDGLSEEPDILPLDLACKMVDDCEEWYSAPLGTYPTLYPYMQDFTTLSVMDLSKMDGVGTAFAALSEELLPKDGTLIT
ncbi:MAG: clostripain-related cysteine peptidase, partial [Thermoplasmata archaeon]|nr:clostripain-related cysteine peptidase [Thermoplasmata archaeon]